MISRDPAKSRNDSFWAPFGAEGRKVQKKGMPKTKPKKGLKRDEKMEYTELLPITGIQMVSLERLKKWDTKTKVQDDQKSEENKENSDN